MVRIRATQSRALTNPSPISNARQRDVHLRSVSLAQESPHDYVGNCRLRNQRIFQVEIEIAGNSAAQLRVTIFPALLLLCSPFVRILPPFTTISITFL